MLRSVSRLSVASRVIKSSDRAAVVDAWALAVGERLVGGGVDVDVSDHPQPAAASISALTTGHSRAGRTTR